MFLNVKIDYKYKRVNNNPWDSKNYSNVQDLISFYFNN